MQVFRRVAELSGFAEAGRRFGLSPAAISKNIAELEAHLGARLINRTTRRMALTEEGRIYLEHVTRGSDNLEDSSLIARRLTIVPHALCAAPSYFKTYGKPGTPFDLNALNCIRFSLSGHADTWAFSKDGRTERVAS